MIHRLCWIMINCLWFINNVSWFIGHRNRQPYKEWLLSIIWSHTSVSILASVHSNVTFVRNDLARRVLAKIISKHILVKNASFVQFVMPVLQGRDNSEFTQRSGMMVLDIVKLKGRDSNIDYFSYHYLTQILACFGFWPQKSKTKTSSLEEIAETMVTSLQPSLLPTKEQIRSLGIDDNELLRTLREGLSQSETTNITSNDTSKTPISSTNQNEEPEVEEITGSYIPNSFELFMWPSES